jgi:hypothetical protein
MDMLSSKAAFARVVKVPLELSSGDVDGIKIPVIAREIDQPTGNGG